ncbi:MAG: hypothetical protein AAF544_07290 [Bacteroidota bacterium]
MKTTQSNKPEWLAKLEQESWQAELIISGIAILGALQLPELVNDLQYYLLDTLHREEIFFWGFIMTFMQIGVNLLILTFIAHFVLRTLWIGIIGINSIFPNGITRNERYSEEYQDRLIADYGDVTGYIKKLDRTCSGIFGAGFSVCLVSLGYVVILLVMGLIAHFGYDYLPDGFLKVVGLTVYAAFAVFAIIGVWMSMKQNKDKPLTRRWQYPMNQVASKIMFNLGHRPVMIISSLFTSAAADTKGYLGKMFLVSMVFSFVMGLFSARDNLTMRWGGSRYFHRPADTTLVSDLAYLGEDDDVYYFQPVIDKRELHSGEALQIFIPLPQRELDVLEKICDIPMPADTLSKRKKSMAENVRLLECGANYVEIALNGQLLSDYKLRRHYEQGRRSQYGFLTALRNPAGLKAGENRLRVTTKYENEDEPGDFRDAYLYFYYTGVNEN